MAQTDNTGRATVNLIPGTQAGNAIVKATIGGIWVDSCVVSIDAGVAASIQLSVSNSSPQVSGTGGNDWTQLIATVYDPNGNPVPDGQWVTFSIIASPGGGCAINQHNQVDSSQTAAGAAMATFNSGTIPGPVVIGAKTISIVGTDTFTYSVEASNISIVSGPPYSMDIQASEIGVDAGSAWDVNVGALVRDRYNNPVRDGIAVFFEVHGVDGITDTAAIMSDTVITGNGLHRPGMAYTILRYISAATNESVNITGRTASVDTNGNIVQETITFKLPLQQPTIQLYCMPNSWHFNVNGPTTMIECQSIVRDGHQVPINNVKVIYGASRGRLYQSQTATTPSSFNMTGPIPWGFAPGHTSMWLRETATYIFPDPQSPEITGDITAEIEGYPDAIDAATVNFRRLPQ